MIYEYFQIKSSAELVEDGSRKICYLCLPKDQWVANRNEIIEHDLYELDLKNE